MKKLIQRTWHVILPIAIFIVFVLLAVRQDQLEAEAPYASRPHIVECFTPNGWRTFRTFDRTPWSNKSGVWLLEAEDGTEFRSSMCQIEEGLKL